MVEHLGHLDFLHARENVVLLGPPGTGKTHLAIAISIRACLAGQRVAFATATEWVARLGDAKRQGSLEAELRRLGFIPLVVVDEVGYIPFDPEAANLMFSLVSARYERASLIVTSNKPFSAWGEILGDEVVAAAMIDRLVHHAEILALKGDSYRARQRPRAGPGRPRLTNPACSAPPYGLSSAGRPLPIGGHFSTGAKVVTFQPALTSRGFVPAVAHFARVVESSSAEQRRPNANVPPRLDASGEMPIPELVGAGSTQPASTSLPCCRGEPRVVPLWWSGERAPRTCHPRTAERLNDTEDRFKPTFCCARAGHRQRREQDLHPETKEDSAR